MTLFSPLTLRGATFRNRIGISPMCQYSATDGFVNDWHLVHLGARAAGGAGLVVMEATGVLPEGRISPGCTGIWDDAHIAPLRRVTDFIRAQGAVAGIQLAHAGRKASCALAWDGGRQLPLTAGGWETVAPSALPFLPEDRAPRALTADDIARVKDAFVAAAKRAVAAGFQLVELHAAHGYLFNSFISPLTNRRTDDYGGSLDNRMRVLRDTARAVRAAVGGDIVLAVRLSCIDWADGGTTIDDSIAIARALKDDGVDIIDCSSGGLVPDAKIETGAGYQVPFAAAIRKAAGVSVAAVGMITTPQQAQDIVARGDADIVLVGRAALADASWPIHAAAALHGEAYIPRQYLRGYHSGSFARIDS